MPELYLKGTTSLHRYHFLIFKRADDSCLHSNVSKCFLLLFVFKRVASWGVGRYSPPVTFSLGTAYPLRTWNPSRKVHWVTHKVAFMAAHIVCEGYVSGNVRAESMIITKTHRSNRPKTLKPSAATSLQCAFYSQCSIKMVQTKRQRKPATLASSDTFYYTPTHLLWSSLSHTSANSAPAYPLTGDCCFHDVWSPWVPCKK